MIAQNGPHDVAERSIGDVVKRRGAVGVDPRKGRELGVHARERGFCRFLGEREREEGRRKEK